VNIIVLSGIMAHVSVSRASILLSLDTIGIDVNVLNGRRMATMCNYRNPRAIIKHYFKQEFPEGDLDRLDKVLSKYSEDEITRVADAVMRFGIAAILDAVSHEIK
jgi:hypothetical protein